MLLYSNDINSSVIMSNYFHTLHNVDVLWMMLLPFTETLTYRNVVMQCKQLSVTVALAYIVGCIQNSIRMITLCSTATVASAKLKCMSLVWVMQ